MKSPFTVYGQTCRNVIGYNDIFCKAFLPHGHRDIICVLNWEVQYAIHHVRVHHDPEVISKNVVLRRLVIKRSFCKERWSKHLRAFSKLTPLLPLKYDCSYFSCCKIGYCCGIQFLLYYQYSCHIRLTKAYAKTEDRIFESGNRIDNGRMASKSVFLSPLPLECWH